MLDKSRYGDYIIRALFYLLKKLKPNYRQMSLMVSLSLDSSVSEGRDSKIWLFLRVSKKILNFVIDSWT